MKALDILKKDPPKFSFDASIRQWVVLVAMFVFLFILPIQAVNWDVSAPQATNNPSVLGIETDNSRYITLPIINFQFDTSFQETATISFTVGTAIIVVALVLLVIFIKDFRKKEYKYSN